MARLHGDEPETISMIYNIQTMYCECNHIVVS